MNMVLRFAAFGATAALLRAASGADLRCGPGAALDASIRLEYAVTASRSPLTLSGDGVVTYQRGGDRYAMTSSLRAAGIFDAQQRSEGAVVGGGLVPHTFSHRGGNRPPLAVEFDWQAGRVTFSPGGATEPARQRMQDRLSLLLQLPWLVRADPEADRFELPVAGHRRTFTYSFVSRGPETIDLPAGRFETIRFERHPEHGDELLEVWLAPRLCSLPVRIRFTGDSGLVVDQRLRSASPIPP
jgi:hypothetical protein